MIRRMRTRKLLRKVGAALVASLMLFAGIANAYCSLHRYVDPGGEQAVLSIAADDLFALPCIASKPVCDAASVTDKEFGQPSLEWQMAAHAWGAPWIAIASPTPVRVSASSFPPFPEPVFRRFPRLLI